MNLDDIHTITRREIEHVLKCLRFIEEARKGLEGASGKEGIASELQQCSQGIYDIVKALPLAGTSNPWTHSG
jgi:hypothetical protein